ncbi:Uncharacterized protein OS=Sorangium cellulosum (strain So ce56) GN=sce5710 PE=4 SV=1 [Gemmataceae bacterium]|nr:Uncharacterized protein OS=Sorangium cellulosum (strain So ce56) GN=sce5710 PE=4 SV=1 [Gemmataceae bacterium]VTT98064.1 Uncharacterized protein OS=Sorangium cellulosum (strain So ce56) GN=sce5710 PE=4 SV=1 [Gemmataceae bacterium]
MTEIKWWLSTEPRRLVDWLLTNRSPHDRKMRLFAHACSAHLRDIAPDWPQAKYLGLGEQFIERQIDRETVGRCLSPMDAYDMGFREPGEHHFKDYPPPRHMAASSFLETCWEPRGFERGQRTIEYAWCFRMASMTEDKLHVALARGDEAIDPSSLHPYANLLREIFGPLLFRDVLIAPEWRTSDVTALARGVYVEKAFDRLPILADALQDAGCDSDEILTHLRSDGPHVRGCWALDLILGNPWREG